MLHKPLISLLMLRVSINLYSLPTFYKYYDSGQKTFDVSPPSVAGSDLISLDIEEGESCFLRA